VYAHKEYISPNKLLSTVADGVVLLLMVEVEMQYTIRRTTLRARYGAPMDGIYIGDKSVFKHIYARRFLHDPALGVAKYADYLPRQIARNVRMLEAMVRLHWHGVQYGELILRCSCASLRSPVTAMYCNSI
jgi:hypothetical protein